MAGEVTLLDINTTAITAATAIAEQITISTIAPADNEFFVFWRK